MKIKNWKKQERNYASAGDVQGLLSVMGDYREKNLFCYDKKGVSCEVTYGEFIDSVQQMAAGLSTYNLADKRVAVIGETSPEWLRTYMAVLAAGGVIVPMDKELAVSEIAGFLTQVEVSAIVYAGSLNGAFAELLSVESLRYMIPMETDGCAYIDHEKVLPLDLIMEKGRENATYQYPILEDRCSMAEMLFTSGTTGTSKCVMLSQKNIFSVVAAAVSIVPVTSDDVTVSVLPPHHTYELACLLAQMNIGVTICINDSLKNVMRNFQKYRPTALVLVPLFVVTMYKRILSEAERSGKGKALQIGSKISRTAMKVGIDLRKKLFGSVQAAFGGRLRKIICGGAALDPNLIHAFEDFGISVFEGFGITECAPLVAVTPYYSRKPGSVGPAVSCCSVRIDGNTLNDKGFMEGEIQVQGDNVMLGYYHNQEANDAVFTEDGWFRTGDIGYMDDDGYLYITGRLKSVIVLDNGKNVFPEEIEEYLGRIEEIAESVVVGRTHEDSGSVDLVALVYPNFEKFPKGVSSEEIQSVIKEKVFAMNKKLPSFKQIRKIECRKIPFEKTSSRKIKRHLVK